MRDLVRSYEIEHVHTGTSLYKLVQACTSLYKLVQVSKRFGPGNLLRGVITCS